MNAPASNSDNAHRQRRSDAIRRGARYGLVARAVSITCTLAQVPLALRLLGPEGFGLWVAVTSAGALLGIADFGVSLSAKTLLAQAAGRDDPAYLTALLRHATKTALALGSAVVLLGLVAAWSVDWPGVFRVSDSTLATVLPWGMTALAISAGASLPTGLGGALAAALDRTWLQHVFAALASALMLAVVGIGWLVDASWLAVVAASVAIGPLLNVFLFAIVRRALPSHPAGGTPALSAEQRREFRRLCGWFILPHAGAVFMSMSLPVLLANAAGPVAVAVYNICQRAFGVVTQAQWMTLVALWPAYAEAHARGDVDWMQSTYRRSWAATLGLFMPAVIGLAVALPWLARWWVGSDVVTPSYPFLVVTAAWFILQMFGQPPSVLLNGLGRLRAVSLYGTAGHALSLAVMLVAVRYESATGVVLGMTAGYLLLGLPVSLREAATALRRVPETASPDRPAPQPTSPAEPAAIGAVRGIRDGRDLGHIAIVIPVHNRRATTLACLERLAADGVTSWADIYVIDDGSTDDTASAVREQFPAVSILRGNGSLWWTGAIALGMEIAHRSGADAFVWLNDDTLPLPGAVARLCHTSRETGAIVSGESRLTPDGPLTYGGLTLSGLRFELATGPSDRPYPAAAVCGNFVCVPRAAVALVGLPDARHLPHAHGDTDYTLRAARQGIPILVEPRARAVARPNALDNYASWLLSDIPLAEIWRPLWRKRSYAYAPAHAWFLVRHFGFRGAIYWTWTIAKRVPITLLRLLVPQPWLRRWWGHRSAAWQREQHLLAELHREQGQ